MNADLTNTSLLLCLILTLVKLPFIYKQPAIVEHKVDFDITFKSKELKKKGRNGSNA